MVEAVNSTPSTARTASRASRLVEITGPAGSGKSTLLSALMAQQRDLNKGKPPAFIRWAPYAVGNALRFFPEYVARYRGSRWFSVYESRSMAYLESWLRRFQRRRHTEATTVWERGPLFRLVRLQAFGPEIIDSAVFRKWRNRQLRGWGEVLDQVVFLDAPDDVLLERIESRDRWHRMRGQPRESVVQFLQRYRESFLQILEDLVETSGLNVLHLETRDRSPEQIFDRVAEFLNIDAEPCPT